MNCNKSRCNINGQLNQGDCYCVIGIKTAPIENIIQFIESPNPEILNDLTPEQVGALISRIRPISYQSKLIKNVVELLKQKGV